MSRNGSTPRRSGNRSRTCVERKVILVFNWIEFTFYYENWFLYLFVNEWNVDICMIYKVPFSNACIVRNRVHRNHIGSKSSRHKVLRNSREILKAKLTFRNLFNREHVFVIQISYGFCWNSHAHWVNFLLMPPMLHDKIMPTVLREREREKERRAWSDIGNRNCQKVSQLLSFVYRTEVRREWRREVSRVLTRMREKCKRW